MNVSHDWWYWGLYYHYITYQWIAALADSDQIFHVLIFQVQIHVHIRYLYLPTYKSTTILESEFSNAIQNEETRIYYYYAKVNYVYLLLQLVKNTLCNVST